MRIYKLTIAIIFALASTACMTKADKMIFQEVFHGQSQVKQTAELSPAAAEQGQTASRHEISAVDVDSEPAKAADASELEVKTPTSSPEAP